MISEKKSLVFFGSGPVAAASLALLVDSFFIEAIITKPTTKQEMSSVSPATPIFCVNTKLELDELIVQQSFSSTLAVLIDFGIIISKQVIDSFDKGILNSHFSLLPELRGADPISFAILEGRERTGVSLMLLVEAMDEGPLLGQSVCPIDETDTAFTLTKKLTLQSAKDLKRVIPLWLDGEISPAPQEEVSLLKDKPPTYTRKLTKADGLLDFSKAATRLEREVRAYAGWPKSRAKLRDVDCVVTKASITTQDGPVGELFIADKKLGIYCGKGALMVELVVPAGKKEMTSQAFLAGYRGRLGL